jgi:hypothetical protein
MHPWAIHVALPDAGAANAAKPASAAQSAPGPDAQPSAGMADGSANASQPASYEPGKANAVKKLKTAKTPEQIKAEGDKEKEKACIRAAILKLWPVSYLRSLARMLARVSQAYNHVPYNAYAIE